MHIIIRLLRSAQRVDTFEFHNWSGRRDSDSRHPAWKAGTLPLSYYRIKLSLDLSAITYPETKVLSFQCHTAFNPAVRNGGEEGLRSLYLLLARQVLYQLSYFPRLAADKTASWRQISDLNRNTLSGYWRISNPLPYQLGLICRIGLITFQAYEFDALALQ